MIFLSTSFAFLSKYYKTSLLYFLVLFAQSVNAQSKTSIDSINSIDFSAVLNNLNTMRLVYQKNAADATTIQYKNGKAVALSRLAIIEYYLNNFEKGVAYNIQAVKLFEEMKDMKSVVDSYSDLGYAIRKIDMKMALTYFRKAIAIGQQYSINSSLAKTYDNYGVLLQDSNIDSAIFYYKKSLQIKEINRDVIGIPYSLNKLAAAYSLLGKYNKAFDYLDQSDTYRQKETNKNGIADNLAYRGDIFFDMNQTDSAIFYYEKSLDLARTVKFQSLVRFCLDRLTQLYAKQNNFKKAFSTIKSLKSYDDSVYTAQTASKIASLQVEFETEKKLQQIAEQKENLKQQSFIQKLILFGLMLIAIFAFFVVLSLLKARKFNKLIAQQKLLAEQQKSIIEDKQHEIIDSITYALRLQQAILPPLDFINSNLAHNFIVYKPKDIVAGDFYWAECVDDLFYIAAADSTGHGVPGAMVSVVCSNALNRSLKEFGLRKTGAILDKTRELIIETFSKSNAEIKDGMDISLLCISKTEKKAYWSGANNALWFVQNNELLVIKPDKQPVGNVEHIHAFTTHEIEEIEDITFYLFTDGFADQFGGEKGKKYKSKQFSELLLTNSNLPMNEQAKLVEQTFMDWKSNLEQVDDVCVIGVKL